MKKEASTLGAAGAGDAEKKDGEKTEKEGEGAEG